MATHSFTPEQEAQSAGFEFEAATDSHEVEARYSWRYVDQIYVTDDGEIVRSEDTNGYYGDDEKFECTCGESFTSEEEAKAHLREERVRGPPVPTTDQLREFSWRDESDTAFDGCVEHIASTTLGAGQLVDGFVETWTPSQVGVVE